MSKTLGNAATLAGRVLFSLIFLLSGIGKIFDWENTSKFMESEGMPMVSVALVGAIVFEIVGALSIMSGFKSRWGAMLLIIFLIPATFIFHDFWTLPEDQQQIQMTMFMKNVSILGGLLIIIGHGPGSISVEAFMKKSEQA